MCSSVQAMPPRATYEAPGTEAAYVRARKFRGRSLFLTVLINLRKGPMPTIAIIGGGTGGNLLAARLLEESTDGLRLHVMLIEARGRAGDHLKAVVRHAEQAAPGAFLTRLRGEVSGVDRDGRGTLRIWMRSGRVLEVGVAAVATGSVAAGSLDPSELPTGVHVLPSDAAPEELHEPVERVAKGLISLLTGPAEEPPRATAA